MTLSLLNLWQGDLTNTQIVIGLFVAFLSSSVLTAIVTYWLTRGKTKAEILGIRGKNQKQIFENFDFGNDVLNEAAAEIDRLRKRELELSGEVHQRDIKIRSLELEKAEAIGQVKHVSEKNELFSDRIYELKDEIEKNERECFRQIAELKHNHDSQIYFLQKQIDRMKELLAANNIDFV